MVIVLHVHTFSNTIPFIMMILLLLQLECLLYVEPGHLDLVLDLYGIVNYLCLLLLLQHSLLTFNSWCILDQNVAARTRVRFHVKRAHVSIPGWSQVCRFVSFIADVDVSLWAPQHHAAELTSSYLMVMGVLGKNLSMIEKMLLLLLFFFHYHWVIERHDLLVFRH